MQLQGGKIFLLCNTVISIIRGNVWRSIAAKYGIPRSLEIFREHVNSKPLDFRIWIQSSYICCTLLLLIVDSGMDPLDKKANYRSLREHLIEPFLCCN
jgi:hypothetical protein